MHPYNSMSREISANSNGAARMSTPSAIRRVERVEVVSMSAGATPVRYTVNTVGSDRRHSFANEQNTSYKGHSNKAITTERIISIRPLQMPNSSLSTSPTDDGHRHSLLSSTITPISMDSFSRAGLGESNVRRASMCRDTESVRRDPEMGRKALQISHVNERIELKSASNLNGYIEKTPSSYQKIDLISVKTIRALGKGSFGEVLLGEWHGTPIAVKRYLDDPKSALGAVEEFNSELQALSILNHPKVVRFLGACSLPPCVFLEYYQRGSLDEHLHTTRTQFNAKQSFSILYDISLGMTYVHNSGVLHRDLKPQNILLDSAFSAKISDFGLAIVGVKNESKAYGMAGTIPYMAPEILLKQPYGISADSYSFGVLVNELFGVQRPYEGTSADVVMKEVQSRGLRPKLSPCVPAIAELISLCWADHPSLRPPFSKISEIFRSLLESTEKLSNVLNSVLATVAKLLSSMESAIYIDYVEARKSLTCLRDMLDPGNDCYDFAEVQGAFLIADGCKRITRCLLSGKAVKGKPLNDRDREDAQVLACEALTNACNANSRCQNQLCELGTIRALVNTVEASNTFSLTYHSMNCLRKACESHPGNKSEAAEAGGGRVLIRWIHRCIPKEGTLDEIPQIPGLQAGEAFSPRNGSSASGNVGDLGSIAQLQHNLSATEAKAIVEMATCSLFAILSRKTRVPLSTPEACGIATLIRCLSGQCTKKAQEYAASSLWLSLEADEQNIELFCKANGTDELLNLLVVGSEDLKKWAAAALNAASVNAQVRNEIAKFNGIPALCKLLTSECLPTCHHASKTLCRAFAYEENIVLAVRAGFFPLVLGLLQSRDQVEHTGLITCLCSSFANPLAMEAICTDNYLKSTLESLKAENIISAETVVKALLSTCASSQICQDAFIKSGGFKQISTTCLQDCLNLSKAYLELMLSSSIGTKRFERLDLVWVVPMLTDLLALDKFSKYPDSEEVCALSIQLLWAAMESNQESRDALHAAHGISRLISILKFGPARCKRLVCAAVRTACIDCPENRQHLFEADGIAEVLKYLVVEITSAQKDADNHSEEYWKAVEHAIAALNNGCCKSEKNCDAARSNDAFSIFLKIFVPVSPDRIKEITALAVVNLCSCLNIHGNGKWVPAMQSALKAYKDDLSTSQSGCKYASAALAILDGFDSNAESAPQILGPIDVVT